MARIAISTLIVIPGMSGSNESYLVNLIQGLAKADGDNRYLLFVTPQNEHLFRLAGSRFEFHRVPIGRSRLLRIICDQLILPLMARRQGASVVHYPGTVGSLLRSKMLRQVVTVHYDLDAVHSKSVGSLKKLYYNALMRRTRTVAAALIVPSDDFARKFGSHWRIPAGKLHVVHHGVSLPARPVVDEEDRLLRRFGLTSGFLMSVTNALPHKNTVRLIDAYSRLAAERGGEVPSLLLVGDIADKDLERWRLECLARGTTVPEGKVISTGYLSPSEVDLLYRRAVLLALPTLTESSSMPVIEAMARRCPVVASDIEVHREIGGDAAVFVDPNSSESFIAAFQRLLDDPDWRGRVAEAGFRRAQQFSWEECARKTAAVYEHAHTQ